MTDNAPHRLPPWLTRRLGPSRDAEQVAALLADLHLVTVCDGAHCPNRHECYSRRTATFMILGETCTRNCRFCAVPACGAAPAPPREDEPAAVAEACKRLALRHVVITSVTRDDLADGGAGHFARTIAAVRDAVPQAIIEVLVPDFQGDRAAIDTVLAASPHVFNHNVETVERLYATVRPQASYRRSLGVLAHAKSRGATTKSGLMVGLGEAAGEVEQVLRDLRAAGCDIVTIGQYLAPSKHHLPVVRYVEPAEFAAYEAGAKAMGFAAVAAGPFVRSSYQAEDVFNKRSASLK
ncbi:MAG: lipoyl synthase [Planctomycetaceae bacterium]|nr:lipoyl synthase [Planctomycetaceae bacterium]